MTVTDNSVWADKHPAGFRRFTQFKVAVNLAFILFLVCGILYVLFLFIRWKTGGSLWFEDALLDALAPIFFCFYALSLFVDLVHAYLQTGGLKLLSSLNAMFLAAALGAIGWNQFVISTNPPPTLEERLFMLKGIKDQIISLEQQGASADEIEAMCVWYAQTAKRSGGWAYQHPKSCEPLMKSQ